MSLFDQYLYTPSAFIDKSSILTNLPKRGTKRAWNAKMTFYGQRQVSGRGLFECIESIGFNSTFDPAELLLEFGVMLTDELAVAVFSNHPDVVPIGCHCLFCSLKYIAAIAGIKPSVIGTVSDTHNQALCFHIAQAR